MTIDRNDYISGIDKALIDEALEWRALMDNDIVDSNKRAEFHAWVMSDPSHMQAFDYAERFWEQLKLVSDPAGPQSKPVSDSTEMSPSRVWQLTSAIGVSFALIVVALGMTAVLRPKPIDIAGAPVVITYKTDIAESRAVELADGSSVVLGPGSHVEARIDNGQRAIALLGGEAFFDVVEDVDKPFSVIAGTARIAVVGTQFEVRMAREKTHIAVADGRVEVGFAGTEPNKRASKMIALNPGQAVVVDQSHLGEISAVSTNLIGAWRNNRLAFFNEPLGRVVEQVNRYDHREILLADSDLATLTVSATLDASDVDALLQTLAEIYPLVISKRRADQIVITRKK